MILPSRAQEIKMMNKLQVIKVYAIKHFWDGYMMRQMTRDMVVFMLKK